METKKILIILGIILFVLIGLFYIYAKGLGSMYALGNKPDESPFYITTKPIVVKNILLPKGTKISYKKNYFWQKYEQKELLNEKNIKEISFPEVINWGGVPITSILKFFNPEMKGFSVYADFNRLDKNKETQFSNLWKSCSSKLQISVQDTDDWSFNKKNISDIESCSVNYQRYFSEDEKQQKFLNDLLSEMMKIKK
ncbi:hypothetical protein MPF19_08890 [Polaribacter sp. Z014]|uniref:hypothetical protein n=1 Tax=unclassified Polaribacter TaxID=196858 RepID=UPI00193BB0AA|nr:MULTISPECIES: hypothetical protein [unclassified Polaribacter]MCL7763527.1 hypothetical protein [Polaribacter sp. Z014]QVY66699.1 hypothetical protein JOP69_05280 [Polaribacter sp. Q13]